MMKEGNEGVVCGGKRGREEGQSHTHENENENEEAEQQKKCKADSFHSCLLALESPELEDENLVYGIDEEHVFNLMKELMEEIGMVSNPPLPLPRQTGLPLPGNLGGMVSNSAASLSTNCSSEVADSTKMEPQKSVMGNLDWKEYERIRGVGDYYGEEDFLEVPRNRVFLYDHLF